jgi:O-methyltransferase
VLTKSQAIYADLLKRSLLNIPYVDNEIRIRYLLDCLNAGERECGHQLYDRRQLEQLEDSEIAKNTERQILQFADTGRKNRPYANVMMGQKRLSNIQFAVETILSENIPGDFLEAGTWKGGGCILMRALLEVCDVTDRIVWVADSFVGVPPATLAQDAGLALSSNDIDYIAVSLDRVQRLFQRYGLLDEQVRFLQGWFKDTLESAPVEKLSLLRVDGDLYESTRDALVGMYDRVSPGGFVIIDDYNDIPACKLAVDEFRQQRKISSPLVEIDWTGVYWRR